MEHWARTFRKTRRTLPSPECLSHGRHSARCRRSKAYRLPRLSAGCVSPPGPRVEPTPAAIAAALRTPAILALYGSSLLTAATIAIYLAVN